MPKHENVIKNYVNFELFHEKDVNEEDCVGRVTVMEKADGTLRTVLKKETYIGERINIAEGIWRVFSYPIAERGIQIGSRGLFYAIYERSSCARTEPNIFLESSSHFTLGEQIKN